MKIIIYALGQIFKRYKDQINKEDIVALCDKERKFRQFFSKEMEFPVILPDELECFDYDFIVIFSNPFFEEIKRELSGEYFVPKDKIISWREMIQKHNYKEDMFSFCKSYFESRRYTRYLDMEMNSLTKKYLTKTEILPGEDIVLDGIRRETTNLNANLYDHIYESEEEVEDFYDIAVLPQGMQGTEAIFDFACKHAKHIVFCAKRNHIFDLNRMKNRLNRYGETKHISTVEGIFWIIDTKEKIISMDVSIYVVIHKKYNLNTEFPYLPLCVGDYREAGYFSEQIGENIAYLNKKINECTALYWIWKNTKSKYVGLNHYRRYFFNSEIESMDNYLDLEHMNEIFQEYDLILPKAFSLHETTILEQIQSTINPELCKKGYELIREKIGKNQPDYLEAFDSVMESHIFYACNIFVTKREVLNRYCEWLFSFLIETAEELYVDKYDNYSQRVIGFFAERMWTVWLRKNKLRIKELPYVVALKGKGL